MTAARGGPGADGEGAQDFEQKRIEQEQLLPGVPKNTLAAIIKEKASGESCNKNRERRRKKNNFAGSRR